MTILFSIKDKLKKVNENVHSLLESKEPIFYDSGCYALNLLLSGSIFGGVSDRITIFAAPPSTGKTFLLLSAAKSFLDSDKENVVVIFESESGITNQMLTTIGLDKERVLIVPVTTVQEFREQCISVVDEYVKNKKTDEKSKLMLLLDSIGMLSTSKEIEDSLSGKDSQDMTRARLLKSTFRVITLKLGLHGIPLLCSNHVYQSIGIFSTTEMSGGQGALYSASTVIYLSKSKDKEGSEVIGSIIKAKTHKSRLSKENVTVDLKLSYNKGLSRYYGLVDIGLNVGYYSKSGSWIVLPSGEKIYAKEMYKNPEKYFNIETLKEIDKLAKPYFNYSFGENDDYED